MRHHSGCLSPMKEARVVQLVRRNIEDRDLTQFINMRHVKILLRGILFLIEAGGAGDLFRCVSFCPSSELPITQDSQKEGCHGKAGASEKTEAYSMQASCEFWIQAIHCHSLNPFGKTRNDYPGPDSRQCFVMHRHAVSRFCTDSSHLIADCDTS